MRKAKLLAAAVAAALFGQVQPAMAQTCDSGLEAFQRTVYAKVRRDCAQCHDGRRPDAPPFAVNDPLRSYETLVSYMNFSHLEESLLVIRAGNGHCGLENCEEDSGVEMQSLASQWWNEGERACERNGRHFTAELPIPANLPMPDAGFATMTFDLGTVAESLRGVSVQIDIQNFLDPSASTKGAYRVRAPRIIGRAGKSVQLRDLKVLLNGKYDQIYNQFTTIEKTATTFPVGLSGVPGASPMLSASVMILLKDGLPNPKLSLSFMELQATSEAAACPNEPFFNAQLKPAFQRYNCASCHNSNGDKVGLRAFNAGAEADPFCRMSGQLVDPKLIMTSPLVKLPVQGQLGHPRMSDAQASEYLNILRRWMGVKRGNQ